MLDLLVEVVQFVAHFFHGFIINRKLQIQFLGSLLLFFDGILLLPKPLMNASPLGIARLVSQILGVGT